MIRQPARLQPLPGRWGIAPSLCAMLRMMDNEECEEEAAKTAAAFFFCLPLSVHHVLFRNPRVDVDCLEYCD